MKKEDADYNYVNYYVEKVMGADPTMRMMAAKDRMKGRINFYPKKKVKNTLLIWQEKLR